MSLARAQRAVHREAAVVECAPRPPTLCPPPCCGVQCCTTQVPWLLDTGAGAHPWDVVKDDDAAQREPGAKARVEAQVRRLRAGEAHKWSANRSKRGRSGQGRR